MSSSIERYVEGAAVFVLVELSAYLTGGYNLAVSDVPIALGASAVVFHNGINKTDIINAINGVSSVSAAKNVTVSKPAPFTVSVDKSSVKIGDTVTFTVSNFNANYELYDDTGTAFTKTSASGTIQYVIQDSELNVLRNDLKNNGYVDVYATDSTGAESNTVRITLVS